MEDINKPEEQPVEVQSEVELKNSGFFERFFKLKDHKTNAKTEVIAGITTFMTMAYILAVNPMILGECGMDKTAVFTATVLCSFVATFLMGTIANLPFVLSAGMGLNAYFAYTVVLQMKCSWELALAAVFVEGIIFIVLSLTNVREAIFNSIPHPLKIAVTVGIGLYIGFIGLKSGHVLVDNPATLVSLISFKTWSNYTCSAFLALVGIIITTILMHKKILGSILWGMVATWLVGMLFELQGLYVPDDKDFFSVIPHVNNILSTDFTLKPTFCAFTRGFSEISGPGGFFNFITVLSAFLFVDLFDTIGTLIGCAASGNMLDKEYKLPGIKGALLADAIGTTLGAVCGTSTVTTFVESASGISAGGRTGLTSIVAAFLFLMSLFFAPLFLTIPVFAITPALVIVGFLMVRQVVHINFEHLTDAVPAFLAIIAMPFFYSISEGISFGIISYTLIHLLCGEGKKVHPLLYVLSVLFVCKYIFI
ncbi:MAG: NCS2 family permease [Candidatus Riflebacteria bacterium]|nr:NCS2 family permease [Candidatus Riflebacteria bacterium]